jgi:hypothetical protein
MATAEIVTDAGPAHLKAIGNPEGEHALAAELLGTQLAQWFGLPTFDFALIQLTDADEVPLHGGTTARPGPAFVTRTATGHTWGGGAEELARLENQDDIARLVVVDTWLRNPDRCPPRGEVARDGPERRDNLDNVFLAATASGGSRLLAMDFSHAFTWGRQITGHLATIGVVQERAVYGLFEEFRPYVTSVLIRDSSERLLRLMPDQVEKMVGYIPRDWGVTEREASALTSFTIDRARWLSMNLEGLLNSV